MVELLKRQQHLVELLLEKKRTLWNEVRQELFDNLGQKLHAEYEVPQDIGDRALIDVLEDTGLALADIRRRELTQIDEAVGRLKEGRYGLCEECGEEIPLPRLEAVPYAKYCLHCQEKQEGPRSGPGHTL